MAALSLVNGKPSDRIEINDRGLAYGDGLFETIAVRHSRAELLAFHYRRLQTSCARLKLNLDFECLLREVDLLLQQAAASKQYVLKITLTREFAGRGYAFSAEAGCVRILQLTEVALDYSALRTDGVNLRYCETALSINPVLAGMKHLARLENVIARAEWSDAAIYEGLMCDTDGYVVEGTMTNLFAVKDNILLTPHLDRCGVAGVMREYILNELAPLQQLVVTQDRLRVEDINQADELFITNSLLGIVPVVAIAQFQKNVGPVTRSLQKVLAERVYA